MHAVLPHFLFTYTRNGRDEADKEDVTEEKRPTEATFL